MAEAVVTMLDGTPEERRNILRNFLGLKEGQTFQEIEVEDDE